MTQRREPGPRYIDSAYRYAESVLNLLVDKGPLTAGASCLILGWPKSRFHAAIKYAREHLCPELGICIPTVTPHNGWLYEATTEWQPVEEGASYSLGMVETRLDGLYRDVNIVMPYLERGTREWRRANFLNKHLSHVIRTLAEIENG